MILRQPRKAGHTDGDRWIRGRLAGFVTWRRVNVRGRRGVGRDGGSLDLDGFRPLKAIFPIPWLVSRRAPRRRPDLGSGHSRQRRRSAVDGLIERLALVSWRHPAGGRRRHRLAARPARLRTCRGFGLGHQRRERLGCRIDGCGLFRRCRAGAGKEARPVVTADGRLIDGRSDARRSQSCRHRQPDEQGEERVVGANRIIRSWRDASRRQRRRTREDLHDRRGLQPPCHADAALLWPDLLPNGLRQWPQPGKKDLAPAISAEPIRIGSRAQSSR